jgi:hypothetical protein
MSNTLYTMHAANLVGLVIFFITWVVLFKSAHLLIRLLHRDPLIGWAIGPLGFSILFLRKPSVLYLWLDTLIPALVSGFVVYIGLFTTFASVKVLHSIWVEGLTVVAGIALSSTSDLLNTVRDLRYPLWGEARLLRCIQGLRASWAQIHFTTFGSSYLNDHFGASPAELLQAL